MIAIPMPKTHPRAHSTRKRRSLLLLLRLVLGVVALLAAGGGAGRGLVDVREALLEGELVVLGLGVVLGRLALRAHELLEALLAHDAHRLGVHLVLGLALARELLPPLGGVR